MIKVAIFTAGVSGKKIGEMCSTIDDVEIKIFVDNNPNLYAMNILGVPIVSPYKCRSMMIQQEIDMVLVPSDRMVSYGLREYTSQLDSLGIEAYKIVPSWIIRKSEIEAADVDKLEELIKKGEYKYINQLQHIQFHIIDSCNLNCKRCQHFSNIAKKDSFAIFEQIEKDFKRLRELFDDINVIAIMGGEPLLNPDLGKYIRMVREEFPHSRIEVITNGILVRQMSDELLSIIRENDVLVNISYYPVLEKHIEEIALFLGQNDIRFFIGRHIDSFSKKLVSNPVEKEDADMAPKYVKCRDACCTTLRGGKIYPCYLPATAFLLNQEYGCDIVDTNSEIDIYSDISGLDIVKRLSKPFPICKWCGTDEIYPWEQTKKAELEDWVL